MRPSDGKTPRVIEMARAGIPPRRIPAVISREAAGRGNALKHGDTTQTMPRRPAKPYGRSRP